jgi:ABC-type multidrug transport system ATPase subunit
MSSSVSSRPRSRHRSAPAHAAEPAISVRGLTKRYGAAEVLHGVDLEIRRGEVTVLGVDPARPTQHWRARIGIVLQTCTLPSELTARELVERFAGYYPAGPLLHHRTSTQGGTA